MGDDGWYSMAIPLLLLSLPIALIVGLVCLEQIMINRRIKYLNRLKSRPYVPEHVPPRRTGDVEDDIVTTVAVVAAVDAATGGGVSDCIGDLSDF